MYFLYKSLKAQEQLTRAQNTVAILVFKTSIRYDQDVKQVEAALKGLEGIRRWNVDRHDIDNVLRIETTNPDTARVISLVQQAGFFCEELPD